MERDLGTGIRVGALLLGCGLVFGNAAAGDWISTIDTVVTFFVAAWPALAVAVTAIFVERALGPSGPFPGRLLVSLVIAAAYLAASVFLVVAEGALW